MTPEARLKAEVPKIVAKYAGRSDLRAGIQILSTFLPFLLLFYIAATSLEESPVLGVACIALASLFFLRIFVMIHECGHGFCFRTRILNQIFGFVAGVFCGMPQYVWSRHHNHHHATNGNWRRYTGPMGTISVEAFARLSPAQQKRYEITRNIVFSLPGAFMYFVFNPRLTWVLGSLGFVRFVVKTKLQQPGTPIATIAGSFSTRYWQNRTEYWHIFANNVAMLGLCWAGAAYFGAAAFFTVYLTSLVLGGAMGIILFSIQHNFEGSYASDDEGWDYHQAAVEGTSCLSVHPVLGWFIADNAYHHVHHLSARIPNYRLAECHREYAHLFGKVKRVRLGEIVGSLKFILWHPEARTLITVEQFRRMQAGEEARAEVDAEDSVSPLGA